MATDFDSAGVYFLSVEEFEWRPGQDNPDDSAGKKSETAETGRDSSNAREQRRARQILKKIVQFDILLDIGKIENAA